LAVSNKTAGHQLPYKITKELKKKMARNKGLSHIYEKDKRALGVVAKSGSISKESFNNLGISNNRICSYLDAGIIKSSSYHSRTGKEVHESFILSEKGKHFCRSVCGINHFISNGNATFHNENVSKFITENMSKSEISTILSERELSDWISDRLQEIKNESNDEYEEALNKLQSDSLSMPDFIYKTDSQNWVAVEVTTANYSNAECQSKLEFCECMHIDLIFVHC
jgi:hypothetical protein